MRLRSRFSALLPLVVLVLAVLAAPVAAGACGPVETVPDEGHHHLVEGHDPPVDYRSTPPTSGWHYRAHEGMPLGVVEEPLSEPEQVSVLAAGGVVITYRDLDPGDLEALQGYIAGEGRTVALTAYPELDAGHVALTAWNRKQLCDGLDLDAVRTFVADHAAPEPDYAMGGEHEGHGAPEAGAAAPADDGELGAVPLVVAVAGLGGLVVAGAVIGMRSGRRRRAG